LKKILHIIGTRPQIIKLAAIMDNEKFESSKFEHFVIDTNQHFDEFMQENLYDDFNIDKDKINFLAIDKKFSNNISVIVGLLTPEIIRINPDLVYVYGDTTSTVAGALAAKINEYKSVHIESGLRSNMTFQIEEVNRKVVDNLSDYLFCPTTSSYENLCNENKEKKSFIVGDITLDIFMKTKQKSKMSTDLNYPDGEFYIITIHRQENIQDKSKLIKIIESLNTLPRAVIPLHHSFEKELHEHNLMHKLSNNIDIVSPFAYSEMITLIDKSSGVITDSGGLQKDAFWLNKPLITIRPKTEWVETLQNKQNILIEKFPTNLYEQILKFNLVKFNRFKDFGDGEAVINILSKTEEILN